MDKLYDMFDKFVHADWMTTALAVVGILVVTALVSRGCVALTRRLLKHSSLLPSSSIFVNVIRVCIWVIGISFLLSTCFNVNVSAILTALGVGGIAVSLGFQDTISNLIGGLQVSVSRIVEPGDNIQLGMGGVSGVVRDVTWRHTTVDIPGGSTSIIPNSMMNTTALQKLPRPENVSIPIVATDSEQRLTSVAHHMEDAAHKALLRVDKVKKGPQVTFSEVTERGFKGTISFTLTDVSKIGAATDAVIRAIAPYVHPHPLDQMVGTMEEEMLEDHGMQREEARATVFADRGATEMVPTADSNVADQLKSVEDERLDAISAKTKSVPDVTSSHPLSSDAQNSSAASSAASPSKSVSSSAPDSASV